MNESFIKLHRKFLNWEWYDNINVKVLFIHLLLTAQYEPFRYRGEEYPAGSLITGRQKLAKELYLTEQQIRTALTKLKSTNEITIKPYSQYSVIVINNWKNYQHINQRNNQRITNDQPTNNHYTRNKERKKEELISLSNDERLGKREREILKSFCKKNKVQNVNAYIKTLIKNGDYKEIIEEEEKKQALRERKTKSVDLTQEVVNPEESNKGFQMFLEHKQKMLKRIK